MSARRTLSFVLLVVSTVFVFASRSTAQSFSVSADASSALSIPLAAQITADQLHHMLQGPAVAQPLVIQVGSRIMFNQAHIPHSIYAGPGSQPSGLQALAQAVASAPKDRLIVIYCGCCPWTHCPNMAPAFYRLRQLGYSNVKALYIANNFGDDWVSKGLPVQHGE